MPSGLRCHLDGSHPQVIFDSVWAGVNFGAFFWFFSDPEFACLVAGPSTDWLLHQLPHPAGLKPFVAMEWVSGDDSRHTRAKTLGVSGAHSAGLKWNRADSWEYLLDPTQVYNGFVVDPIAVRSRSITGALGLQRDFSVQIRAGFSQNHRSVCSRFPCARACY
jgi:hypothetical protein